MSWLSSQTHAALIRDPGCITHVWASHAPAFRALLPSVMQGKPADLLAAAFCSLVSHDLKPYGASTALELSDLLSEPSLDCDNYCALTTHLFGLLRPQTRCSLAQVGWDDGPIGNHAQMVAAESGASWLLDPTIGLIAAGVTLDTLCRGVPVSWFAVLPEDRLPVFRAKVRAALSAGTYRVDQLLYWYAPATRYLTVPRPLYLPTPAGQR